jgi:phosphoglycerate dehydrogenase-like enzyme
VTVEPREDQTMPINVLVTSGETEHLRARLGALGPAFQVTFRPTRDRAEIDALEDPEAEVLIGSFPPRDRRRAPRLRWLQLGSAGVDHLAAEAPWDHGLIVTNARGVFAPAVGQFVLTEILRINERVDERRELQLQHRWAESDLHDHLTGPLVRGQVVVIVGYGGLGREVARLVDALGMRVIAVKNRPEILADSSYRLTGTGDAEGTIPERVIGPDRLAEVVPLADVIVLTLPLTARSRGLFNAGRIAAMQPKAWLVNVSRGAVVDETALTAALIDHRIGGAVLDVFGTEPLPPDSPFWDAPNAVVTPHVSGGDAGSDEPLADLFVQNLNRYAAGTALLNVVDGDRQY